MYVSDSRKPLVYVEFSNAEIEKRFWECANGYFQRARIDERQFAHRFSFDEKIVHTEGSVVREELRLAIRKLIGETYGSTGTSGSFTVDRLNIDTEEYRDYHIDGDLVRKLNPRYQEHAISNRPTKRLNRFGDPILRDNEEPKYGQPFLRIVHSGDGVIISPLDHTLFEPAMMADACDFIAGFYVMEGVRSRNIADHRFGFNYSIEVKLVEGSDYDCTADLEKFIAEIKMHLGV